MCTHAQNQSPVSESSCSAPTGVYVNVSRETSVTLQGVVVEQNLNISSFSTVHRISSELTFKRAFTL